MQFPFLLNRHFRTGAVFQLKEWHQLSNSERQLVKELSGSDDLYGLFLPATQEPDLTAKLAYTDTALLYFHFQKNLRLPYAFANQPEETINKLLLHLVLDRLLEIEWKGKFVCGSGAVEALFGHAAFTETTQPSFLSSLSLQAISSAYRLRHQEVKPLAQWLYTCHTWPLDAATKSQYTSSAQTVYEILLSKSNRQTHELLEQSWRFVSPLPRFSWYSWLKPAAQLSNSRPTYKLYISPAPSELPEVLSTVIPVLTTGDAFCFKIGATVQGLMRPDKLIVYFTRREALFETALVLEKYLQAHGVQGVPFTCQLDQRGMLSWGVDPPAEEVLQSVEDGSWRTRVTEQLALAILQAKKGELTFPSAVPFLKAKLLAAGINPFDWTAIEEQN
jgi:hypothetical protein